MLAKAGPGPARWPPLNASLHAQEEKKKVRLTPPPPMSQIADGITGQQAGGPGETARASHIIAYSAASRAKTEGVLGRGMPGEAVSASIHCPETTTSKLFELPSFHQWPTDRDFEPPQLEEPLSPCR